MDIIDPRLYIAALSKLHQRVIAIKYGLLRKFEPLDELENEINSRWHKENDLNISTINSPEVVSRYENKLIGEYSEITKAKIVSLEIDDEMKLYTEFKEENINLFKDSDFKIKSDNEIPKALGFNVPRMISLIKNADRIYSFDTISRNFFVTSKTEYHNQPYLAFFHLVTIEKQIMFVSFFISKLKDDVTYSPSRIFLRFLHKYGDGLKINGKRKRFYYEEPILIDNPLDFKFDILGEPKDIIIVMNSQTMLTHRKSSFIYCYRPEKYLKDVRNNQF